ncbi:MAG: hypothetical protein FJY07_08950 [Bacteroidetes bacterium]|nr:hypothetical protein [Bacteroidota bacterium]
MKRLIKNLFQRKSLRLPLTVVKGFQHHFPSNVNVEWSKIGKIYEVLFYENETEKIARFDKSGNLVEVRTNISPDSLPDFIKSVAESKGEIMNSIQINKPDSLFYEVIVRENPLKRIMLLMNEKTEILELKIL